MQLGFPESKAARLHIRLAHCYQQLNRRSEAREEFEKALGLMDKTDASARTSLRSLAKRGLTECSKVDDKPAPNHSGPTWKCVRPSLPKLTGSPSEEAPEGESCHLVSASPGTVRLRNTGNKRGWTLEVTRDVPAGKQLLGNHKTPPSPVFCFVFFFR